MNKYITSKEADFNKALEYFKKEASVLRTGRANPAILEGILVDSYGVKTPINGLASVNVPDGQSITITPWDKSVLKNIEKAIVDASTGLGVVNEGEKIRLTVPRMTEENRKELVKRLNEMQEEARISFRRIRDEIKTEIEDAEKSKEITEDDKFKYIKDLDEAVSKRNEELKAQRDKKETEIMTI